MVNEEGRERSYRYDADGNLIELKDFDGSLLKKEYNALGKLCRESDAQGRETSYHYDRMWNLTQITYPDKTSINGESPIPV